MLEDEDTLVNLQVELAALLDVGKHFVKATYDLEADTPLFFTVYETLQEVLEACNQPRYPNVAAVAEKIAEVFPGEGVTSLYA